MCRIERKEDIDNGDEEKERKREIERGQEMKRESKADR